MKTGKSRYLVFGLTEIDGEMVYQLGTATRRSVSVRHVLPPSFHISRNCLCDMIHSIGNRERS